VKIRIKRTMNCAPDGKNLRRVEGGEVVEFADEDLARSLVRSGRADYDDPVYTGPLLEVPDLTGESTEEDDAEDE
jgi:hypothetical protein